MTLLRCALLLFFTATAAYAEWTIRSASSEPGRLGLVHRQIVLENSQSNSRTTLDLAVFSTKACTLRVIDQPSPDRADLAETMQRHHCLAGVNGGYFDSDYSPVGLLVSDGKIIAPLRRARLITGVLAVSSKGMQILRVREFPVQEKFGAAVQCGPFLVENGRSVGGLDATRTARRTFALVGGTDRGALGFCSGASLLELAKILATPHGIADFKVSRAINLDGGSSSAFWFARENGGAYSVPEQKPVRDFVAVTPR
jgi:exopolysaccharide biosynthesis protein